MAPVGAERHRRSPKGERMGNARIKFGGKRFVASAHYVRRVLQDRSTPTAPTKQCPPRLSRGHFIFSGLRGASRSVRLCGMHRGRTGGSPGNKRIRQILSAVNHRYWGRILVRCFCACSMKPAPRSKVDGLLAQAKSLVPDGPSAPLSPMEIPGHSAVAQL